MYLGGTYLIMKRCTSIRSLAFCIIFGISIQQCVSKSASNGNEDGSISFITDYSEEANKILRIDQIKEPTSNEMRLAKKVVFERNNVLKERTRVEQYIKSETTLRGEVENLKGAAVVLSCGRQFRNFLENFGRGFMLQIGRASDLYPSVNKVFTQIKAFVKNRFDAIRKSVIALQYLYNSKDKLVGATEGQRLGWSKQVMNVYNELRKINIATSTQPDASTSTQSDASTSTQPGASTSRQPDATSTTIQNPPSQGGAFLTNLILDFKAAVNESDAIRKFQHQCHSCFWFNISLQNTELINLAVQAPIHEKIEFVRNMTSFNLSATEVDFVTDFFISGTYFKEYKFEQLPKWYEQCATVLYFSRSYDRENFEKQLEGKYGSELGFRNMVDRFCFSFATLYGSISNEDIHQLLPTLNICKPNSTQIHDYINRIGTPAQKVDEYRLIASVIGLIAD